MGNVAPAARGSLALSCLAVAMASFMAACEGPREAALVDHETARAAALALSAAQTLAGRDHHLADVPWSSAENGWGPVERDRSNGETAAGDGRRITINGNTYARGLGVHAPSAVLVPLEGACSDFHAEVGLDDEVGDPVGFGSVTFQVWADGALLFDSGLVRGTTPVRVARVDLRGRRQLALVVTDGGDGTGADHADWADAQLHCGNGTGLRGTYHSNADFTGAQLARVDGTVAFDWAAGAPAASIGAETFSVRWTGSVQPRFSEVYTFSTVSDDGIRLWVDGKLLVDNWTIHAPAENAGSLALTAGRRYDVKLEYFESTGSATAKLLWASPRQPKGVVPRERLYPTAAASSTDGTAGAGGSGGGAGGGGSAGASGGAGSAGTAGSGSAGSSGAGPIAPAASRANARSAVGSNLAGLSDWSTERPFVDAFKTSRDWISGSASQWDDGRALDLDANGWVRSLAPGQMARTLLLWEQASGYPAGRYVVLYEGRGTIEYWAGAARDAAASVPGRDVLDVTPAKGGIGINLTSVDASNPLRNIRVLMPGGVCSNDSFRACRSGSDCGGATCASFESVHATQIFHPTFLERVKSYRSLRFMDWGDTNDSRQSAWAGRPKPGDARWTTKGAPVEIMVDLANRLGADPWFTIPHLADDNYVREYARVVAGRLAPGLRAYVEHSNEVWNGVFGQAGYASERGRALGLGGDPYTAQIRYHSRRSVEIFKIWQGVFGDTSRIARVMAAQAGNVWTATEAMDFGDARAHTDVVAIAPYFGGGLGDPARVGQVAGMTVDGVLAELETREIPEAIAMMREHVAAAQARGLRVVAYEGGQHLVGYNGAENDARLNTLFDAVNRHARMGALYRKYLDGWRQAGGTLFVHFLNCSAPSRWGRWGALETQEQPRAAAPKYDALHGFLEAYPRWW